MKEFALPPTDIIELYDHILDNNLEKINTPEQIKSELERMNMENEEAIREFSNILVDFTDNLAMISNNALINNYKDDIIKAIKSNPKLIIDTFIQHGYLENDASYRKQIIIGNEEFFLNETYSQYTNKFTDHRSSIIDYIFKFKEFWNNLDDDNKEIIKTYMMTLCFYSDKRFIVFERYKEIKRIHGNNFNNIFDYYDQILS